MINAIATHLESCMQFCLSFSSLAFFSASDSIFNAGVSSGDGGSMGSVGGRGAGATFADI